ncbi:hypothetical protein K501DRAFT_267203, partial [Backusella circina FSU 941]
MSSLFKRLSNFSTTGGSSSPHGSVLCEYIHEFKKLDTENNGFITETQAMDYFKKQQHISENEFELVWNLSSVDGNNGLSADEFAMAMHLVDTNKRGNFTRESLPITIQQTTGKNIGGTSLAVHCKQLLDILLNEQLSWVNIDKTNLSNNDLEDRLERLRDNKAKLIDTFSQLEELIESCTESSHNTSQEISDKLNELRQAKSFSNDLTISPDEQYANYLEMSNNLSSGSTDPGREVMPGAFDFNDNSSDLQLDKEDNSNVEYEHNTSERKITATSTAPIVPIPAVRNLVARTEPIMNEDANQYANNGLRAINHEDDADINQAIPQTRRNNNNREKSTSDPAKNEPHVQSYTNAFIKEEPNEFTNSNPCSENMTDVNGRSDFEPTNEISAISTSSKEILRTDNVSDHPEKSSDHSMHLGDSTITKDDEESNIIYGSGPSRNHMYSNAPIFSAVSINQEALQQLTEDQNDGALASDDIDNIKTTPIVLPSVIGDFPGEFGKELFTSSEGEKNIIQDHKDKGIHSENYNNDIGSAANKSIYSPISQNIEASPKGVSLTDDKDNISYTKTTSTNDHIISSEDSINNNREETSTQSNIESFSSIINNASKPQITGAVIRSKFDITPVPPPRKAKPKKTKVEDKVKDSFENSNKIPNTIEEGLPDKNQSANTERINSNNAILNGNNSTSISDGNHNQAKYGLGSPKEMPIKSEDNIKDNAPKKNTNRNKNITDCTEFGISDDSVFHTYKSTSGTTGPNKITNEDLANLSLPKMKMPSFGGKGDLPDTDANLDMKKPSLPDIPNVDLKGPSISGKDVSLPGVPSVDLKGPSISGKDVSLPDVPDVNANIKGPELPDADGKGFSVGGINMPKMKMPSFG